MSTSAFECPRCGAAGPHIPGRSGKGLTRLRWTGLCLILIMLGIAFPPMLQTGEFSINGRTTVVNHKYWPAWIGMADDAPDVGYARNGQMETIYWDITRSINRPAWYGIMAVIAGLWFVGMFRKPRKVTPPVSHYPQVVVPKQPAPAPQPRAIDRRAVQPPPRQGGAVYPGVPSSIPWRPADPAPPRNVPPAGGRFR